jgi:formylglycine-generating enzyme required for sulfatase activity
MADRTINHQEALDILGLKSSANQEMVATTFREKRGGLEQKIFQAPTEALKEKYRKNLRELEQAYQVLQSSAEDEDELPSVEPDEDDGPQTRRQSARERAGHKGPSRSATADGIQTRAKLPYHFLGAKYFTAEELAQALQTNWTAGFAEYESGKLGKWIKEQLSDPHFGEVLGVIEKEKSFSVSSYTREIGADQDNQRFALVILLLDPSLPFTVCGYSLTDQSLEQGVVRDLLIRVDKDKINHSPLPGLVERISGDRRLLNLRDSLLKSEGGYFAGQIKDYTTRQARQARRRLKQVIAGVVICCAAYLGITAYQTHQVEQARIEAERAEQARKEAARIEAERQARKEAERIEAERAEQAQKEAARIEAEKAARQAYLKAIQPEMVSIPGGSFYMGNRGSETHSDEQPVHEVTLSPFLMSKYEITFAQWDTCVSAGGCTHNPADKGWGRGNRPVIYVSWHHAQEFIGWLNRETGKQYRLPTEAEWEYAARAGTSTESYWGDEVGINRANCEGCGTQWDNKKTAPVGSFAANAWGLHDMHGNVWEWCSDWYADDYYQKSPRQNPQGPSLGSRRVDRGGGWSGGPWSLRAACRGGITPDYASSSLGFRLVLPSSASGK